MPTLEHHLSRLRAKPEHVRKHIAFWSSLGITLVIVAFWAASLSISNNPSATAAASSAQSPWGALSANVSGAWSSFVSSIGSASTQYQSPVQVTPGKQ